MFKNIFCLFVRNVTIKFHNGNNFLLGNNRLNYIESQLIMLSLKGEGNYNNNNNKRLSQELRPSLRSLFKIFAAKSITFTGSNTIPNLVSQVSLL